MSTTLAALLLLAADLSPSRPVWAVFERTPTMTRETLRLELGTLGASSRHPYRLAYYARRTVTRAGGPVEVRWADSRSCPAMVDAVGALRDLPMPRIDVPGFPVQPGGVDETIVLDGIIYRFALPDRLAFSANVGSPLARWTEGALTALQDCWRSEAPAEVG